MRVNYAGRRVNDCLCFRMHCQHFISRSRSRPMLAIFLESAACLADMQEAAWSTVAGNAS